jgi:hypothetical protein
MTQLQFLPSFFLFLSLSLSLSLHTYFYLNRLRVKATPSQMIDNRETYLSQATHLISLRFFFWSSQRTCQRSEGTLSFIRPRFLVSTFLPFCSKVTFTFVGIDDFLVSQPIPVFVDASGTLKTQRGGGWGSSDFCRGSIH